jgi:parallel beta helix pectate lyase-like protein
VSTAPAARRALLLCVLCSLASMVFAEDLWVSPSGADGNPGTALRPFATPARAMREVRRLVARGLTSDVVVRVHAGRYELPDALRFGPEDAGTDRFSVTWQGEGQGQPVFSGGRVVAGWRVRDDGVWWAPLPEGAPWDSSRSLFVAGSRAIRARSPRADAQHPYLRLQGAILDDAGAPVGVRLRPEDFPVEPLEGAEIVLLTSWASTRRRVVSADSQTGEIRLAPPHLRRFGALMPRRGLACYFDRISRVPQALGEWSLDRGSDELLYRPRSGERPGASEAIVPVLAKLLIVEGRRGSPVRNLHFRGLAFRHAAWTLPAEGHLGRQAGFRDLRDFSNTGSDDPYWAALARPEAAVSLRHAESCSLSDCEISRCDTAGVDLAEGCVQVSVEDCNVFDVGSTGILEGLNLIAHYLPDLPGLSVTDVPCGNRIVRNDVYHCGLECLGAVGIWSAGEATFIARNHVHDLPYTGVSLGWMWDDRPTVCFGNSVEDNRIHAVGCVLPEAAGVYVLGRQKGSVLRGNRVWDVRFNPASHDRPHWGLNKGIHLDQGSAEILVEGNRVHCRGSVTVPIHFHRVREIVVRDNTFASPGARTPWRFARCDETDVRLEGNRTVDSDHTDPPKP